MIDAQKLSQAIADASAYPAACEQLRAAWIEVLNTLFALRIPLPERSVVDYSLENGRVECVYGQGHALIEAFPPFIEYLHSIAQTACDAQVLADAMRKALADERVQAALAMRALEKSGKPNNA
jgi:hypothetical protein